MKIRKSGQRLYVIEDEVKDKNSYDMEKDDEEYHDKWDKEMGETTERGGDMDGVNSKFVVEMRIRRRKRSCMRREIRIRSRRRLKKMWKRHLMKK